MSLSSEAQPHKNRLPVRTRVRFIGAALVATLVVMVGSSFDHHSAKQSLTELVKHLNQAPPADDTLTLVHPFKSKPKITDMIIAAGTCRVMVPVEEDSQGYVYAGPAVPYISDPFARNVNGDYQPLMPRENANDVAVRYCAKVVLAGEFEPTSPPSSLATSS